MQMEHGTHPDQIASKGNANNAGTSTPVISKEESVTATGKNFSLKDAVENKQDIHLSGEQTADLNDFNNYEYNDIQSKTINEDGSVTISSDGRDPHMAYRIE